MTDVDPDDASLAEMSEAARRRSARTSRSADFEVALGTKIKAAHLSLEMSQTELGRAIGVSFQQVQKYERGADRIAASTLQSLAEALGVHPGSFFDDVPAPTGRVGELREMLNAATTFHRIRNPVLREHLLALAQRMAEMDSDEPDPSGTKS